ncbi:2Fe-2S iron-sulfur cluster binding domain protein [Metarhizium guizhouense ARSEF 977]|uniref:2Fe-2S iron-sulfur cluster binding domain protein n=1 Tax=Metarhizium guizhouense (strain ARSEF 977) TaxID=1276136 RepID=A0A0B4H6P2_METGA|nr:2Fe-2S iron-sulfur cluster binding domain protein [Metarhizium guizhouense ARSEF 977]
MKSSSESSEIMGTAAADGKWISRVPVGAGWTGDFLSKGHSASTTRHLSELHLQAVFPCSELRALLIKILRGHPPTTSVFRVDLHHALRFNWGYESRFYSVLAFCDPTSDDGRYLEQLGRISGAHHQSHRQEKNVIGFKDARISSCGSACHGLSTSAKRPRDSNGILHIKILNTESECASSNPFPGEELYVTFVEKDGEEHKFAVSEGDNLLDIAQANDLEMEGACGGSCACSTCHVIVTNEEFFDKMPEPEDDENDMLDLAFGLTETSRLGCQVKMTKELDGLVVKLPSMTRNLQASDFQ